MSGPLHVDDAGFVRAPQPLVYRRLTAIDAWPSWWAGLELQPRPPVGPDPVWAVRVATTRRRRLHLLLRPHGWRHDAGFRLELRGDVVGQAEFWLEATGGGTLVHHLATFRTELPAPLRVLSDYRRALRRGLWGIKDRVQVEARSSAGLLP